MVLIKEGSITEQNIASEKKTICREQMIYFVKTDAKLT